MNYETHEFDQGSPEWHAHRDTCNNASDLSAAAGESPYKSRDQLIRERATGEKEEINAHKQRMFDDGHRFEELARPLAEEFVGEELYPSVVSAKVDELSNRLGVSYDGKTMADDIIWEHKTLNDKLATSLDSGVIPDFYHYQMEQGMLVCGASKCLFTASKWDGDNSLIDIKHVWYESNPELRAKIIPIWRQLEADVAVYQHVEVIPSAVAAPTLDLPAVSIQTSGSIAIISNLKKFGDALQLFIERLPSKPSTDQEFADCKAALTKLKAAEDALDSEEARALSQLDSVDEMRREKKLYQDLARTTRLALEKLVVQREAAIKNEIMQTGKDKLAEHLATLNKRLGRVHMPVVPADFGGAIKSKRTVASLQNAVDTVLANAKIAANEIADKIQINLATLDENKEYAFLFNDLASLAMKAPDDLQNVIKLRIAEHQAEQDRKLEAEREKIRKEEQAKAEREANEKAAAERKEQERIAAEAKANADREAAEKSAAEKREAEQKTEELRKQTAAPALQSVNDLITREFSVKTEVRSEPTAQVVSMPSHKTAVDRLIEGMNAQALEDLANHLELWSELDAKERQLTTHYIERLIGLRQSTA